MIEDNATIRAYADMVRDKKRQYVSAILDIIEDDGEISVDRLHNLHDNLKQYVLLDLTYQKLIDIYMR